MGTRFRLAMVSLGMVFATALAVNGFSTSVSAVVDDSPDCNDGVAVINCGVRSVDELRNKYDQKDYAKIYGAFGISRSDLNGEFKQGIVWRDGRITVDGKTVATGAMTAGRNYGGTPIAGTNAGKYSTSKFATEGQTAFVKMNNGKFSFAVIKSCGNPVTATPKQPEKPQPPKMIKVCVLATKQIKEIAESNFDRSKHSKNLNDCKTPTPPQTMQVCELSTKKTIVIKKGEFSSAKHSQNFDDCAEVKGGEAPEVIASTGPEALLGGLFGSSAVGYGAYSYYQSRRDLISKLLKK